MTKRQVINIGVEESKEGLARFIEAWHQAESGAANEAEVHLNFENFALLSSILTPKRLELLKVLRRQGPLSVRALSKVLARDYKNVYVDTAALKSVDLILRNDQGLLITPWDAIDARVQLTA